VKSVCIAANLSFEFSDDTSDGAPVSASNRYARRCAGTSRKTRGRTFCRSVIAWHPAIQANKLTRIVSGSDDVAFLFQFCRDLELPGIRETSENLQQALSTLLCCFISSDRNPSESKRSCVESGVNFVRLKISMLASCCCEWYVQALVRLHRKSVRASRSD
jgi:hypothetical protein